jgi:hypothetical protein
VPPVNFVYNVYYPLPMGNKIRTRVKFRTFVRRVSDSTPTTMSASQSLVELQQAIQTPLPGSTSTFFTSNSNVSDENASQTSSLPPVDRGFGAWSFVRSSFNLFQVVYLYQLAAAFTVEAIVWGFPTAYGVFLDGTCLSAVLSFLILIL